MSEIGITIKADVSGLISVGMAAGTSVDKRCKPGRFYVYFHKDKDGTGFPSISRTHATISVTVSNGSKTGHCRRTPIYSPGNWKMIGDAQFFIYENQRGTVPISHLKLFCCAQSRRA